MSESLNLNLPDDLVRFVADHADGDAEAYVQSVLRERMELDRLRESLREGIDRGLNDLDAGRFVSLDSEGLKAELEAIKTAGRDQLKRGA